MKKTIVSILSAVAIMSSANALPTFTDLISLGTNGIGALDAQSQLTTFVQGATAVSVATTVVGGDQFYNAGDFGPVDWSSASGGLFIRTTITTNPLLPFHVEFFDGAFNSVALYTGATNDFTTGMNQADSTSYSYLNFAPDGGVDLSSIGYLQFTFDGGASTSMTMYSIATTVPEPSTYVLLAISGLFLVVFARRRNVQA
jgi:hypothetical protein